MTTMTFTLLANNTITVNVLYSGKYDHMFHLAQILELDSPNPLIQARIIGVSVMEKIVNWTKQRKWECARKDRILTIEWNLVY